MWANGSALVLPTLPPTLNNLDRHQRTRLIHSTRKLGAVFGTTPFLIEPEVREPRVHDLRNLPIGPRSSTKATKAAKAHHRSVSVVSHSPTSKPLPLVPRSDYIQINSSSSSLSSTNSSSSMHKISASGNSLTFAPTTRSFADRLQQRTSTKRNAAPKALVLQMSAVPVTPSDHRALAPITPSSPRLNTPYCSTPNTPALEKEKKEKEKTTRRRRMTKLTRQLGENVPPELVFPAVPPMPNGVIPTAASLAAAAEKQKKHSRRRSMTIDQPPSYTSSLHSHILEAPVPFVTTVREEGSGGIDEQPATDYQDVLRKLRGLKARK